MEMAGGGENNGRPRLPNMVPPIFAPYQGTQPQNMTLRDCNKNSWHLKIEKVGDNWYFTDGWRKFLLDNNIEGGDTLLYESSCQGLIDFKILGSSGCERGGVGVQPLECKNTRGQDGRATDVKAEDVHLDGEIEEKPHPLQEQVVHTRAHSKNPRKRRRNSDFYGGDIFRSGEIPVPLNPYFVTRLSQTRVNELYVPLDVIKSYRLQLPERMELVDPSGRRFEAIRKIWTDGRILYFGGWKAACRVNMVQKDDHIICEFVGEGRDMHMKFLDSLVLCYKSLCSYGDRAIAEGTLLDFMRQVSTFGLSLVRLDIRQEADRHTDLLDAITNHVGLGSYKEWSEEEKQGWLLSSIRT